AEIALALELEARAAIRARQRRLQARPAHDLERIRVQRAVPVVRLVGPRRGEEVVVEPHLGRDRVRRRHPVDGPLHAPSPPIPPPPIRPLAPPPRPHPPPPLA